MKATIRLLSAAGALLLTLVGAQAAASGTVRTIGGSFQSGFADGDNLTSLFNNPHGLAIDTQGHVLVADFGNNLIRSIDPVTEVTTTFPTAPLSGPIAVAVDSSGRVLVANQTAGTVVRFNSTGGNANQVIASGLTSPTALAIDASGNIYVAVSGGAVRRFTSAGVSNLTYRVTAPNADLRGLAIATDGTFVVTDAGNQVLWKFPIAGGAPFQLAGTMGVAGARNGAVGIGQLNSPQQLAIGTNGVFVVADFNNHRIRYVNTDGVIGTLYGADPAEWAGLPAEDLPGWRDGAPDEAELRNPYGVVVDAQNTVYDSEDFYSLIKKAAGLNFPTNAVPIPGNVGGGGTGTGTGVAPNRISLGFSSGEASSDFRGAPGQRFIAPVTLTISPGQTMYGLQFNLMITNADLTLSNAPVTGHAPLGGYSPGFSSMLMRPDVDNPDIFRIIPPATVSSFSTNFEFKTVVDSTGVTNIVQVPVVTAGFSSLIFANAAGNLLGVGWLERRLATNLYNTKQQDLIKYSQPHDYVFNEANLRIVPGGFSFVVPANAVPGDKYTVRVGRPSANSDGIAQDVVIETPDGSDPNLGLLATRTLLIETRKYLVGDVLPFRWFNAGDFGDGSILNNDMEQIQEAFAYRLDIPPVGSDMYDALDSCCIGPDGVTNFSDPATFQLASDPNTVNKIAYGDGVLDLQDLYVTFRRSLDPSLTNYNRYWSGGSRVAEPTTNSFRGVAGLSAKLAAIKPKKAPVDTARLDEPMSAHFSGGAVRVTPGQVVHVPITMDITGPLAVRSFQFTATLAGLDGATHPGSSISFTGATGVGQPTFGGVSSPTVFSGIWFETAQSYPAGHYTLGTIDFVVPTSATADSLFSVQVTRAEASSGLTKLATTSDDGMVLMANRAAVPWNDEIPDAWRIQYFGSLMNVLSAPDADADGDGMTNLEEYRAGTNPNDVTSRFALNGSHGPSTIVLKWPTVSGKYYKLESASSLTGAVWTVVEDHIAGNGGVIQRTPTLNDGETKFYRVHTE